MTTFPPWTGYNFVPTLRHSKDELWGSSNPRTPPGTVVCVTGASRGIGAAIARTFAEAGATTLILVARSQKGLQQTKELCLQTAFNPALDITLIAADVGTSEGPRHIADAILAKHDRLDILINNAGIVCTNTSAFEKLESVSDDQFDDVTALNYLGRLKLIKRLIPLMRSSSLSAKTIINVSSIASHFTVGTPIAFNISELANNRLVEILAETYQDEGFLVHAVHPGMVATIPPPGLPPGMFDLCTDSPDLCGAFLVWLTAEPRPWLSGRYLSANWDLTELGGQRGSIVDGDKLKMRMVV